jgi:hypothetical protein
VDPIGWTKAAVFIRQKSGKRGFSQAPFLVVTRIIGILNTILGEDFI